MTSSPADQKKPDPSVLRMTAPLVISFVMRAAFTFVDTAYAATIGDDAVAAIGLAVPFEFLMIAMWVGMSTGLTSCLSRAMGAHQGRRIDQYLRATLRMVVFASPLFALLAVGIFFFAERVGLEPEVGRQFKIYGTVLIGGAAFTSFWSVIPDSVVKAHQDTRSTMWAGIASNLLNVALNTLFLFVFGWGIFGIALSTVIGRLAGLAYATAKARGHERRRIAAQEDDAPGLDPSPYWSLLRLALPASIVFGMTALESLLINYLLAGMSNPTEAIAAYSIYYRVALFALNPIIALGIALLPYAALRWGRADLDGMRRGLRDATAASVVYSLLLVAPVVLLLADPIARALAESPVTARYAAFALKLVPISCLAGIPFLLARPIFEAMQQGRPGLIMGMVRYLVLTTPLCFLGIWGARQLGQPELYGLVVALLAVGLLSSGGFGIWLLLALRRAQPTPAGETGLVKPLA